MWNDWKPYRYISSPGGCLHTHFAQWRLKTVPLGNAFRQNSQMKMRLEWQSGSAYGLSHQQAISKRPITMLRMLILSLCSNSIFVAAWAKASLHKLSSYWEQTPSILLLGFSFNSFIWLNHVFASCESFEGFFMCGCDVLLYFLLSESRLARSSAFSCYHKKLAKSGRLGFS